MNPHKRLKLNNNSRLLNKNLKMEVIRLPQLINHPSRNQTN